MPRKPRGDITTEALDEVLHAVGAEKPTGVLDALLKRQAAVEASAGKNPAAVMLGRLGGLKGGRARANALSAKQRKEIAQKAAKKRWAR